MPWKLCSGLTVGLVVAAAAAGPCGAEPIAPLKPMAFLAGHCWSGHFGGGAPTDEHCFAWLYDGKALRDTHTVRAPGRADYVGETTYYWDAAAGRVEYLYIENLGGIGRGTMQAAPESLLFEGTQHDADGGSMMYRVRWTRLSDASYEAWSETPSKDGWTTMFRLTMERSQ